MDEFKVLFPLQGEWTVAHTPVEKVPSHGVDILGQTYAYDFLKIDWTKKGFVGIQKIFVPLLVLT